MSMPVEEIIEVTPRVTIDTRELELRFVRASGPGGQNVNKVATAVQLRFDVARSPSLEDGVRRRLLRLAGRRATLDGVLVIDARRHRTQLANRREALERLVELVRQAAEPPATRRPRKVSRAVIRRRLEAKRRRGRLKSLRRSPRGGET